MEGKEKLIVKWDSREGEGEKYIILYHQYVRGVTPIPPGIDSSHIMPCDHGVEGTAGDG